MDDQKGSKDQAGEGATPVMAQYLEIKAANPGGLLFYRMGDFYELFFADAEIAARDLGITLTKRGKHLGEDIPMCGVPVHAADGYLQRLIRIGHKVAVCEQMEDPAEARKRGSKAVVRREVIRLVTPGTLTDESLLDSRSANHLVAVARHRGSGEMAIAWTDISSGDLAVTATGPERLAADILRLAPSEIILADSLLADPDLDLAVRRAGVAVTPLPGARFDSLSSERRLKEVFEVGTLDAFGSFSRSEIAALGGLLEYVVMTQAGRLPHVKAPRREVIGSALLIDPATRANLELTRTLGGEKRGSLLSVIDFAMTPQGSRCLSGRLSSPLAEPDAINARLDLVAHFVDDARLRDDIRGILSRLPDLERSLGRLAVGRSGPRDLAAIRDALTGAAHLADRLAGAGDLGGMPDDLAAIRSDLASGDAALTADLGAALADELPLLARDGGFVRAGYFAELDDNRKLRDDTRQVIASLQATYTEATGIKTLKVKHNNVLGYFIEVPASSAAILNAPELLKTFFHRQTVANAMRFATSELASLEQRIAAAADRALSIEQEIFARLAGEVVAQRLNLSRLAERTAELDVAVALAELAVRRRFVRPKIDGSAAFAIVAGRHPVVEAAMLADASGSFVSNDCDLSSDGRRVRLLTGPNMAGKSTYLRQNALIVVLAQMGSFVPADAAHIGVVDRLFSRVGAADDLARGRSTFMVEMVETAAILNQATEKSFVILDEIGRGTATYDGLSIAWAVLEYLHTANGCRALFATHYHELTELAAKLPHLANATVKVKEWEDQIIFLHEVVPGVADRSYGIHVARLAGLPPPVIARAQKVLDRLERAQPGRGHQGLMEELPLFAAMSAPPPPKPRDSAVEKMLAGLAPDELSPREALALLYELKAQLPAKQ